MADQNRTPGAGDLIAAAVSDAIDTTKRIKADAKHLRDVGKRALTTAKVAISVTGDRVNHAIDSVLGAFADGIIAAEKRWKE
jgi:hypothetical protein